jgi:hypothetical protein
MERRHEYRFKIDIFSVDTLPMFRLADYMAELARLFGEKDLVHFSRLEPGSAVLVSVIDEPAAPKVQERLQKVSEGGAPQDAIKAFNALDTMLAKDNAVAVLISSDNSNVIKFPGRTRPKPVRYGPFREHGSLDGVLIRIGGRDETIPLWLKSGDIEYHCQVRLDVAKRIARYYLGPPVRVYGSGKWVREENGSWVLQQFDVDDFEVLDDSPLTDVVRKLRAVEGGSWGEGDDAVSDILGLRRDPGEQPGYSQ